MNTIRLSATSARNNFFELLNQVAAGTQVIIEKDKKEIALLSPRTTHTNWKGLLATSKKVRGILKDYSDEDNPLRRNGASNFLGQWDKDLHT